MAFKDLFKLKKGSKSTGPAVGSGTSGANNLTAANGTQTPPPATASTSQSPTTDSHSMSMTSAVSSSMSSAYTGVNQSNNNIYSQYMQLSKDPAFPQELTPVVTLLNCQAARVYMQGEVYLNMEYNDQLFHSQSANSNNLSYQLVEATIRGSSLLLSNIQHAIKPISIDLLEATVKVLSEHSSIIISTSNKVAYHLKIDSLDTLQEWMTAIYLSNYEFTKLNESYTASLLSSKATQLSDLHVLMSEAKFEKEDWVNIKFSKNSNWIRCYVVISPNTSSSLTRSKKNREKKVGTMSFYSSTKTSRKNLIFTITNINYAHAVYPHFVELIDNSALLKVCGDVKLYEFGSNRSPSHSRTPSLSRHANNGNNNNATSSAHNSAHHNRHASISSVTSNLSTNSTESANNSKGLPIDNTCLYILPETHAAVKPFETMIRLLLPIFDCFKLYGRPKRLIASKIDEDSLLFGLPSLPRCEILDIQTASCLVKDNWSLITATQSTNINDCNFKELFNSQLISLYAQDSNFGGFGDLKTHINSELGFEHPFSRPASIMINNEQIAQSDRSPKYALSISDLPPNISQEALDQINNSSNNLNHAMLTNNSTPRMRSNSAASQRLGASPLRNGSYNNLHSLMEKSRLDDEEGDVTVTA